MVGLVVRVLEDVAAVSPAGTVREALAILARDRVDAIVCDLRLPDGDGLAVLRAAMALRPPPPFVLMTAYASVDTAVSAMREGAFEYLAKPFDPDELREVVQAALSRAALTAGAALPREGLGPILGRSLAMGELFALMHRVAPTDTTVVVLGETGTGKELVARALHDLSPRRSRPFFAINCAAIPKDLLESELFGHARGSFLGAEADRAGLFEAATGSTLLLDEIGDMRPSLQAKLTRVLETRAVRRVGDAIERPVDVRIVVASNKDLPSMVAAGTFREDLWFRLNMYRLDVPPLRERPEDIPLLAMKFLADKAALVGSRAIGFTADALNRLLAYEWPGNVRELRGVVERAAMVEPGETVGVSALPVAIRSGTDRPPLTDDYLAGLSLRDAQDLSRDEMNRRYLTVLLRKHAGDVSAVATQAAVEPESIYRLMRRYGLSPNPFRVAVDRSPPSRRKRPEEAGGSG